MGAQGPLPAGCAVRKDPAICGIAGVAGTADHAADVVPRVWGTLAHRGPDDRGYLALRGGTARVARDWDRSDAAGADALLVHTRLSILDLSDTGWQPMRSADGRYHVVYNGEIYNYLELRQQLQDLGHAFTSTSDTEVLLAAYAEWGSACLERLVGMFSFAILDGEAGTVFLARDFFGIKPLFYRPLAGAVAFASNLRALFELAPGPRRVARGATLEFLRFGLTDHVATTMFEGVYHLPPAHCMEIPLHDPGRAEPRPYWSLSAPATVDATPEEAAAAVRAAFLHSVDLHLRSDVEVGAALSGGIDSSALVMAMRELRGDRLDIRAFSFVPDEPGLSEERWIDLVGRAAAAEVYKVQPRADELVEDLPDLIDAQGEPFASTNIYAQYRVFRLAHDAGIKVMLNGQGADELLAGYRSEVAARLASLARRGRLVAAGRLLHASRELPDAGPGSILLRGAGYLVPDRWQAAARRLARRPVAPGWMRIAPAEAVPLAAAGLGYIPDRHVLRGQSIERVKVGLPHLLRYDDRNSMAFSIESRVPFLTPRLAELILSLPEEHIVSDHAESKSVFRLAMRGIVPDAILDRKDKIGFETPTSWIRQLEPWVDKVLSSDAARSIPMLDVAVLRDSQHVMLASGSRATRTAFWRALNLVEWARLYDVAFE